MNIQIPYLCSSRISEDAGEDLLLGGGHSGRQRRSQELHLGDAPCTPHLGHCLVDLLNRL